MDVLRDKLGSQDIKSFNLERFFIKIIRFFKEIMHVTREVPYFSQLTYAALEEQQGFVLEDWYFVALPGFYFEGVVVFHCAAAAWALQVQDS